MSTIDPMKALNYLPHPLVIVTAGDPDNPKKRGGMTAAWCSRVSWSPPMIMVSIAPSRYTLELIRWTKEFAINLVGESLEDAAYGVFGTKSGRYVDKFKESGVKMGRARSIKAPIIEDSTLVLECRLVKEVEAGDHVIVIGEVVDASSFKDEEPLVFLYGGSVKIMR